MNAKNLGSTISELRKKNGMTQINLAEKLNISPKTVSKWENGLGYPEITQFPTLASIFGVTIDYLMTGKRQGICFAGNILADVVKTVDIFPQAGMLANITSISKSVGGCVPNTAIDLAKIDKNIPITAVGRVGDDENGRYIVSVMQKYGVDASHVVISDTAPTSFSDVISAKNGERTFFHIKGANSEFSPDDIDLTGINCKILHTGYILLLDKFDKEDSVYGTVMARFLHNAQKKGIKTSIDVVSDNTGNYNKCILPALKYCNYAILNEIESTRIFGIEAYKSDGSINIENMQKTMELMVKAGVKDKVIVHAKLCSFILDAATGNFTYLPSVNIRKEDIKGSVGAGDAFCAGSLYGIYNGYSDEDILRFASSAAICNLFSENSIDGMKSKDEINKMEEKYGRIIL